jgi:hypothetical protein
MSSESKNRASENDLESVLRDLASADAEARQLVEGLSDEQLNWHPNGTAWSVAQCLDHLAQVNVLYTSALSEAVRGHKPKSGASTTAIHPGWLARWFIRTMDPPPRKKFQAPKKVMPVRHRRGDEVLQAFIAAHDHVRALILESQNLDLNRIRFRNPFVRIFHFTVGTGLLVIGAHDRRHLWQARQVLALMKAGSAGAGAHP